jgi:hypothetical protein
MYLKYYQIKFKITINKLFLSTINYYNDNI